MNDRELLFRRLDNMIIISYIHLYNLTSVRYTCSLFMCDRDCCLHKE